MSREATRPLADPMEGSVKPTKRRMLTSSAKSKGRRCCAETKELLYKYAPDLKPGDIEITSSGAPGVDLKLSPAASEVYPLVIECKCQESIQIWAALKQAEQHATATEKFPAVFFRRNHSKLYVALEAEHFIKLIR